MIHFILITLLLILNICILVVGYYCVKFRNPYKLTMVFGKKGSGKTTLIAKLSQKYIKKGRTVYSTVPIPGTYLFDPKDIGFSAFPEGCVIFIDEVGMIWDNRNFKNFLSEVRDYFKLQRHYKHTVYLFSQAFDIDVKLRNLTDQMYLTRTYFNCISIAKKINRSVMLVHPSGEGEARIADDLEFVPLLAFWASPVKVTWIPAWTRFFNSYDVPELKEKEFTWIEYPDNFEESTLKFKVVNYFYGKAERATNKILGVYLKLKHRDFL